MSQARKQFRNFETLLLANLRMANSSVEDRWICSESDESLASPRKTAGPINLTRRRFARDFARIVSNGDDSPIKILFFENQTSNDFEFRISNFVEGYRFPRVCTASCWESIHLCGKALTAQRERSQRGSVQKRNTESVSMLFDTIGFGNSWFIRSIGEIREIFSKETHKTMNLTAWLASDSCKEFRGEVARRITGRIFVICNIIRRDQNA